MGASHTTLSSTDEQDGDSLPDMTVEQRLYPGSGRMMRTFRLKHSSGALVVAKHMWISQEHESTVKQEIEELRRIRKALENQHHVAPFLFWNLGDYRTKTAGAAAIRPVHLLRPHVYTTLSDRLASRPFLAHVEKLWIVYQLLRALQAMHDAGVVHGFLTTENVGLSSWNWVVLVDVASYKARTKLPDDDPSEYLYYFQELNKHGTDTTPREKRCYLAPERFVTASRNTDSREPLSLTPAMDIFSAGCVVIETFLNGERALDLGDVMEYRRQESVVPALQQKLNKIESSSLRAACRHMLHVDPSKRLCAKDYLERLESVMPPTFENLLEPLFHKVTCEAPHPDARMAIAASHFQTVLRETVSSSDPEGERYIARILGRNIAALDDKNTSEEETTERDVTKQTSKVSLPVLDADASETDRLMAETEALLQKLNTLAFGDASDDDSTSSALSFTSGMNKPLTPTGEALSRPKSPASASSLLTYLQLVLSTVRTVQRPSSKLVGLQMLERCGRLSSDEVKLQRIVPTAISLLNDQEPLVRARSIEVLTSTVAIIQVFPPSDAKIFQQYIFKRVAHLISDQSLVVRLAFARCIALLAETALRFLDISHAVRLYEAVGAGGAGSETGSSHGPETNPAPNVFTDDVARLLDEPAHGEHARSGKRTVQNLGKAASLNDASSVISFGDTLISSTYSADLAALQETVSRWVVQITTDQSSHSSPTKRSLLCDLTRLCNFFGRDGAMAFILPQILAFLNDRRDWQLRAALFHKLASVCYIVGRAATEHFVLPCLEMALIDSEDQVIHSALVCLTSLVEMGLLSRSVLASPPALASSQETHKSELLKRYMPLLLHPSMSVSRSAIAWVNASLIAFGFPDGDVFLLPLLRPYIRYRSCSKMLRTVEGLERCLLPPLSREELNHQLISLSHDPSGQSDGTQWTSIDSSLMDTEARQSPPIEKNASIGKPDSGNRKLSEQSGLNDAILGYLKLYIKGRKQTGSSSSAISIKDELRSGIEGSLKLAQSIKFPKQRTAGTPEISLPSWYAEIRELSLKENLASESFTIRSVTSLGQVYGLSLLHPSALEQPGAVGMDSLLVADKATLPDRSTEESGEMPSENILRSKETKIIEAASAGEWGSDALVDPTLNDTALLVSKLKGLRVPVLPPDLGKSRFLGGHGSTKDSSDWKPRVDGQVASSSLMSGHSASVSRLAVADDQTFFVSGSLDGTCRVWELRQLEDSDGILESSSTYTDQSVSSSPGSLARINDVAILDNSHSVASAGSDGTVHVWRVDMVVTKKKPAPSDQREMAVRSVEKSQGKEETRVSGSTLIRKLDPREGEVLKVAHFNSASASVLTFATQSIVHSWDLRSSGEPFKLEHPPEIGYQTSLALGTDRHWLVTGTSRGFVALWDIRFQQMVKLWQHSESSSIRRLATTYTSFPAKWGNRTSSSPEDVPYVLAACGKNECALFDLTTGSCRLCFRVVNPSTRRADASAHDVTNTGLPLLHEIPLTSGTARTISRFSDFSNQAVPSECDGPSITAMVGRIGGNDRSYLITGGEDCCIRYWNFSSPSKCYSVSGLTSSHQRPTFERIDSNGRRYVICQQPPVPTRREIESSKVPRLLHRGTIRPENRHFDAVQDVKLIDSPMKGLLSCSRDGIIKVWR